MRSPFNRSGDRTGNRYHHFRDRLFLSQLPYSLSEPQAFMHRSMVGIFLSDHIKKCSNG
jgi:hypothetical protein